MHQDRNTVSPPLAFNKNTGPIVQREVRHVVHSKPIPYANVPQIGNTAESREYIVHPVYSELNFNQYDFNTRPTEKSIR